ncbi:Bifunctional AAC/APH [compost metagenome]
MLKQYENRDFKLLQSWVTDAELLFQFAGTDFHYPITEQQLTVYKEKNPDRHFYIGYYDNQAAAFGEIIPQSDAAFRLGRLIVGNPNLRGQGLGYRFDKDLVNECKETFHAKVVDLFVWEENHPAIRCYQKAGFSFTDEPGFFLQYNDKQFTIHKMSLRVI